MKPTNNGQQYITIYFKISKNNYFLPKQLYRNHDYFTIFLQHYPHYENYFLTIYGIKRKWNIGEMYENRQG